MVTSDGGCRYEGASAIGYVIRIKEKDRAERERPEGQLIRHMKERGVDIRGGHEAEWNESDEAEEEAEAPAEARGERNRKKKEHHDDMVPVAVMMARVKGDHDSFFLETLALQMAIRKTKQIIKGERIEKKRESRTPQEQHVGIN